jgi:hypothetical protein
MRGLARSVLVGIPLLFGLVVPLAAQDAFALKAGFIYNRSEVEAAADVSGANGFSLGLEYVFPGGLGLGVSAYTGGRVGDFDSQASSIAVAADANYFFSTGLPLAPYVGVHSGLGRYSRADDERPSLRPRDSLGRVGYQAGLRFQLMPMLGLDAQYRRVSSSLRADQPAELSRDQLLIGITLF